MLSVYKSPGFVWCLYYGDNLQVWPRNQKPCNEEEEWGSGYQGDSDWGADPQLAYLGGGWGRGVGPPVPRTVLTDQGGPSPPSLQHQAVPLSVCGGSNILYLSGVFAIVT